LRICNRCVMDDLVDPDIQFDNDGVCNHCHRYSSLSRDRLNLDDGAFASIIDGIKHRGRGKKYDCIVGVSGGVDSSYVAYLAAKSGLRVLAVHVDNGWNSELAVRNIEQLVKVLGIPLRTVVLNWNEFKSLQIAFLRASTPDGEIPTDHAIYASLWRTAHQTGTKTILSGMNFQTESIYVPSWSYGHMDSKYLRSVSLKNGGPEKFQSIPTISLFDLTYFTFIRHIRSVSILNYIPYVKQDVITTLRKELDWRPYEGKHFESSYTKFYQGYVLPKQFNIDKRKGHLSDLIYSGQINRERALRILSESPVTPSDTEDLKRFVCTKFGLSKEDLEEIISTHPMDRSSYSSHISTINKIKSGLRLLRRWGLYPK